MPVDLSTLLRDGDPTREIRRYIEQLQDAVRDACTRQTLVEEERDRLSGEVARLRTDNETLRNESRETRRDRDTLSEQAAQYGAVLNELKQKADLAERGRLDVARQRDETMKFYKDSQRQIEEVMRIKDEAVKQRDAFARQRDNAKREREDLAGRITQLEAQLADARKVASELNRDEVYKQITALRQARDAAATQCAEFKQRISQLEDEIANISYDRDSALQSAIKAAEETEALRTSLEQAASDAVVKNDAVKDEAEELKKKIAALKRRNATLSEAVDALTTEAQQLRAVQDQASEAGEVAAAELSRELEKLAREREAEMEEYGNKLNELRAAHDNELQIARQQYEAAMNERDAARTRAQEREAEMDELRNQLAELRTVIEQLGSDAAERVQQLEALQSERHRAEAAEKVLDEARNSLVDAQKQIEYIIRDRDAIREQMAAQAEALEDKLKQLTADQAELKRQLEQAHARSQSFESLTREHEAHRLQIIELSARLATAHAEIKELGAHLAEARLKAKAGRDSEAAESLDPVIKQSLTGLRRTFQEYLRQPAEFNSLNELQNHAQRLGDRARETGQMIVQRVSSVLAALTRELYEMPDQATPSTMRSVGQSIEFIATLLKESGLDERVSLTKLSAFAVDDDHSVLDSICEALEAAGIATSTTDSAGAALAELAVSSYDLLVLDVDLPELDGLELCSHIREMDLHATTPVVFVTGHATLEHRVQFSLRGGSELFIKPFNLLELALRSLSLILKRRLQAQ
jgi:CheY-like chemotaxis protein/chromosome segregation ATPase